MQIKPVVVFLLAALVPGHIPSVSAQPVSTAQTESVKTPRDAAPVDLTGYWVSVVIEDWRWRMVTPPKGDYTSVPLNDAGRKLADTWDPAQNANSCKHYGAAGLMRKPMRVRLVWETDQRLRLDTDHGAQTRRFYFGGLSDAGGESTLQGRSVAQWADTGLKVDTTRLTPGYLRWNGVPYSKDATLTEYYDRYSAAGEDWLTVTTVVSDPTYLTQDFITTTDFKRLKDESSWHPVACESG